MEVQLVLLRLADVQDLDITALHADGQPVLVGAVAQGKNLGVKREEVGSKTRWDGGRCPEEGGWGRGGVQRPPSVAPAQRGSWPRAWKQQATACQIININQHYTEPRGLTSIICSERTTALGGRGGRGWWVKPGEDGRCP